MTTPAKNTICLWYNGDAEEAARLICFSGLRYKIKKPAHVRRLFCVAVTDLFTLQKIQQILIQLLLVRVCQSVRGAFVDDQF